MSKRDLSPDSLERRPTLMAAADSMDIPDEILDAERAAVLVRLQKGRPS